MQLVAPDILSDACGLSVGLIILGLVMGIALWLFGWRCHRFWIVLITTVLAGVYGLYDGTLFRAQPLIAALLLALAGGLLALALVRLLAFLAGGMFGALAAQSFFPSLDPPICFLIFGLISLCLFRLAMMALTSIVGTLLMGYSALSLLNHYGTMDAVNWVEQGKVLLNWICVLVAILGCGFQFFMDQRRLRKDGGDKKKDFSSWDILLGSGVKWGMNKKVKKAG
jgi:MFS family permease